MAEGFVGNRRTAPGVVLLLVSVLLGACATGVDDTDGEAVSGDDLYQMVEDYSEMGDHRTGTDVDRRTVRWFAGHLEAMGAEVTREPFSFDRFESETRVSINGEEVPSTALYYEAVGRVETNDPYVTELNVLSGHGGSGGLSKAIEEARRADAEVAVIATRNALDTLQVPNRTPELGSGMPVVLVAGRHAQALITGTVRVSYDAAIRRDHSDNVIARLGDHGGRPVVLATPLSGWFTCAAERGTGIAVTLGLARAISDRHDVVVIGAPGHELLPHIGLEAYLKEQNLDPALVVHLGANVGLAVKDPDSGEMRLAAGAHSTPRSIPADARFLFTRMSDAASEATTPAFQSAGLKPIPNPPRWFGEALLWAEATDAPLWSLVGKGQAFHTPLDVPANTTGAEPLRRVFDGLHAAILAFMDSLAAPESVAPRATEQ